MACRVPGCGGQWLHGRCTNPTCVKFMRVRNRDREPHLWRSLRSTVRRHALPAFADSTDALPANADSTDAIRNFTNGPEEVGICDMSFQPYYLSNSKLISCSAWGLSIVFCISISVSTFWRIPILRYIPILVCLHLDFHPHVHSIPILPLLPCNFPSRRMWDPSCRNASSLQPTPMEAKHSAFAKLMTKSLEMFFSQELPALSTSQQGRCRSSWSN